MVGVALAGTGYGRGGAVDRRHPTTACQSVAYDASGYAVAASDFEDAVVGPYVEEVDGPLDTCRDRTGSHGGSVPPSLGSDRGIASDDERSSDETMTVREASETALVIPVPEAEPAVGRWRDRLDPACTLGVPAHITVLYPFVPPSWLDQTFLDELGELLGGVGAFEFELTEVRWFDEDVVWVEPKPAEPFLRLTELVVARWPEFPPYQGAHAELVPHLTIAQDCPRREMEEAAAAVARELPIRSRADRVWLMAGGLSPGSWEVRADFPLAT